MAPPAAWRGAATVALLLVATATSASAIPVAPVTPPSAGSGWGVNIHWTTAQAGEAVALAAGYGYVRMDLTWSAVEKVAGVYNFSAYDTLVAEMAGVGVRVMLILDYFNPAVYGPMPPFSQAQADAFGAYALAAVTHFRTAGYTDLVFECFNEPNGMCTWRVGWLGSGVAS